jgi:hypothetical protein
LNSPRSVAPSPRSPARRASTGRAHARGASWTLGALVGVGLTLTAARASAQAGPPGGHDDQAFDVMNVLADHGLHDIHEERWNLYGQFTYISSWKRSFQSPYENFNGSGMSLTKDAERSFTGSFTLFFGMKLWPGGEAYLVPEVISEKPLSGLHGLGGSIQNFELQKTGGTTPQLYRARTFLRQTFGFGGARVERSSDPMQLATVVDSRRLTLTMGSFTILDVFDRSSINWDPRQTFLNMAFMTHSSWDFPSDARGYSWGGTAELNWDDWAVRFGRITPPKHPNDLPQEFRFFTYYGDQIELEHDHKILGQTGAVRLLGFRNRTNTARFDDAIAAYQADPAHRNAAACEDAKLWHYDSTNTTAPDLCWARKPNVKVGAGLTLEQHLTDEIGVFLRAMYVDGNSEVGAYNPADRSLSFGAVAKGHAWHRPFDVAGAGFGASWISDIHAKYLAMGGVDGFVGDGKLNKAAESVVDVFYSFNLLRAIWVTADYQRIWNPGFNADRGPVTILGGRVHAEF